VNSHHDPVPDENEEENELDVFDGVFNGIWM